MQIEKWEHLVIQKAGKGNTIVILDKDSYLKLVEPFLKDSSKFKNIPVAPNKDVNYVINSEKRVSDLLKKLKNKNAISEETYNKLKPVGSKRGTLYGSAKVHKPLINGLPPFRLILSAIGTPTYKLAKFLVPVLSDITQNEFTVKDSFTFVDEILTQNSDLYMASLDVDALFTNIALDETIDICVKKLCKTPDTLVKGISKNDCRDLLHLATKESFFTFNNKFYIQVDGVAMGSPLGPILASISLSHHEENWLKKCPIKFKPTFYRRCVDDIFVLFESSESADSFREYVSSKHQTINFTVEKKNVSSLSFLDVKIYRKNGKFVTTVYRKPTFSGFFTNYEIFIQRTKREHFYTHYFIRVLAYVVISRHFILKSTI